MTALLASTIALVLLVISSLEYPFAGDLRIQPEAFQDVLDRMDLIEQHEKEWHLKGTEIPSNAK